MLAYRRALLCAPKYCDISVCLLLVDPADMTAQARADRTSFPKYSPLEQIV